MDEQNPYAAPNVEIAYAPAVGEEGWAGLWRSEKGDLVMHVDAKLPNICVKSGVPTAEPGISKRLTWHNPWIALAIIVNLLLYIILALVLSKRARIEIPLSPEERGKRTSRLIACWAIGLASVALLPFSFWMLAARNPNQSWIFGIVLSFVGGIGALIAGQNTSRILRPIKITDTHVWLRGVHASITDSLPPLPPM